MHREVISRDDRVRGCATQQEHMISVQAVGLRRGFMIYVTVRVTEVTLATCCVHPGKSGICQAAPTSTLATLTVVVLL